MSGVSWIAAAVVRPCHAALPDWLHRNVDLPRLSSVFAETMWCSMRWTGGHGHAAPIRDRGGVLGRISHVTEDGVTAAKSELRPQGNVKDEAARVAARLVHNPPQFAGVPDDGVGELR